MAVIANFNLKDGKYTGTIRTMTINVKAQIVPNENQTTVYDPEPSEASRRYGGCGRIGRIGKTIVGGGKPSFPTTCLAHHQLK